MGEFLDDITPATSGIWSSYHSDSLKAPQTLTTLFFPNCLEFLEQLASSSHTHSDASDTQERQEIKEEEGRSAEDEKEYTANEEEAVKRYDRGRNQMERKWLCYTTQSVSKYSRSLIWLQGVSIDRE